MAARRCPLCGINYPADVKYQQCPIHEEVTVYDYHLSPDADWQWKATAIQMGIEGKATTDEDGILKLDIPIHEHPEGLLYISSHDVVRAGVHHRLPPDEVLAIGPSQAASADHPHDNLYEVVAYIDAERAYWIRRLKVPDHVPAQ